MDYQKRLFYSYFSAERSALIIRKLMFGRQLVVKCCQNFYGALLHGQPILMGKGDDNDDIGDDEDRSVVFSQSGH